MPAMPARPSASHWLSGDHAGRTNLAPSPANNSSFRTFTAPALAGNAAAAAAVAAAQPIQIISPSPSNTLPKRKGPPANDSHETIMPIP